MSFDNVCKLLAEKYPFDFAKWLLPQAPKTIKVLKTELSIEPIRADFVTFLQTENRILHIEFQTNPQSKPPIPFRELDYSVRLIRTYQVPVTQVVIFLQETDDPIVFTEEYVTAVCDQVQYKNSYLNRVKKQSTMIKPIERIFISNSINRHSNCLIKSINTTSFCRT